MMKALEETRKIIGLISDTAVLADLFVKDGTGKFIPNPVTLPGYARNNAHTVDFNTVMAVLDPAERVALELQWIPTLHPIQNDDLAITVAAIKCVDLNTAKTHLKDIAAVNDPGPSAPGETADAVLARINEARTQLADSLNLIKNPVTKYHQYFIDEIKGEVFGSGAALVAFLQSNWPVVKAIINTRVEGINTSIERPAGPVNPTTGKPDDPGGLHACSLSFLERMRKRHADSK